MAIFADGVAFQEAAISTSSATVFTANSTALAALDPAVELRDLTILNTGPATVYLGNGTATTAGLPLAAGQQVTIQGWTATSGTTTNDIHGITASGTANVQAGLATVASVV